MCIEWDEIDIEREREIGVGKRVKVRVGVWSCEWDDFKLRMM